VVAAANSSRSVAEHGKDRRWPRRAKSGGDYRRCRRYAVHVILQLPDPVTGKYSGKLELTVKTPDQQPRSRKHGLHPHPPEIGSSIRASRERQVGLGLVRP
jgi:hypothetical protein